MCPRSGRERGWVRGRDGLAVHGVAQGATLKSGSAVVQGIGSPTGLNDVGLFSFFLLLPTRCALFFVSAQR
ncbi:MAG TPA: hypothetical protein VF753_18750 [Terriglobales bacterium]